MRGSSLASTSEVYGDPLIHPQPESYWGNVNPVGPRGVYDEAKRFAEAMTMAYHRFHGVDTKIVRIFNTFGPRMRVRDGRAIPNFLLQALNARPLTVYGDGSQTRSFCYVDDLVDGIVRLLHSDLHDPVNLGNPEEWTVLRMAEVIRDLTGANTPIVLEPLPIDDPEGAPAGHHHRAPKARLGAPDHDRAWAEDDVRGFPASYRFVKIVYVSQYYPPEMGAPAVSCLGFRKAVVGYGSRRHGRDDLSESSGPGSFRRSTAAICG